MLKGVLLWRWSLATKKAFACVTISWLYETRWLIFCILRVLSRKMLKKCNTFYLVWLNNYGYKAFGTLCHPTPALSHPTPTFPLVSAKPSYLVIIASRLLKISGSCPESHYIYENTDKNTKEIERKLVAWSNNETTLPSEMRYRISLISFPIKHQLQCTYKQKHVIHKFGM